MCIGSKVPPRIPVRTAMSIGPRGLEQPKRTRDIRSVTAQTRCRIDIRTPQADRHVYPWNTIFTPSGADHIAASHSLTGRDSHPAQEGNGHLHPGDRLHGHGPHSCHGAREGDDSGCRCSDRIPHIRRIVDSPVPGIGATRGIGRDDFAVDRNAKANCCDCENENHGLSPGSQRIALAFR